MTFPYYQSKGIRYLSGKLVWNGTDKCCLCNEYAHKNELLVSTYIVHLDQYIFYHEDCCRDGNIDRLLHELGL
jgi:hypothetical protein